MSMWRIKKKLTSSSTGLNNIVTLSEKTRRKVCQHYLAGKLGVS